MHETPLRERLAALQHAIWSHWMRYMFAQGTYREIELDGKAQRVWIMPEPQRVRWERQMAMPYGALPAAERESDRDQADKVLSLLRQQDQGKG